MNGIAARDSPSFNTYLAAVYALSLIHIYIRVLKDILGHQNLGTTEIYTHLSNQQMEDAADANPLSKVEMSSSKHKKSE